MRNVWQELGSILVVGVELIDVGVAINYVCHQRQSCHLTGRMS